MRQFGRQLLVVCGKDGCFVNSETAVERRRTVGGGGTVGDSDSDGGQ